MRLLLSVSCMHSEQVTRHCIIRLLGDTTALLLFVIAWRRWCSLISSLRSGVVDRLVLLWLSHISLLTRLHRCIPLFASMLTVLSWSRDRGWRTIMTLLYNWRGSVTVESARLGVMLIMGWNVDGVVSLQVGCRGDNVECVNDSWDLITGQYSASRHPGSDRWSSPRSGTRGSRYQHGRAWRPSRRVETHKIQAEVPATS